MVRKVVERPWLAAALILAGTGALPAAAAPEYILEVQQSTGENVFARNVYVCPDCTLEQFAAVTPPVGFVKKDPKLRVPDASSSVLPTPGPGVAPSLDLVPDIPGDDFDYIARVTSGQILEIVPGFGPLATAEVARDVEFRYAAGRLVHELSDPDGFRWILFSYDLSLLDDYDLEQPGSLAPLPIPDGWTYASRVLDQELVIDSNGLAHVFAQGELNNWQRYDPTLVPEPSRLLLTAAGLAVLALRWRGARRRSPSGRARSAPSASPSVGAS